MTNFTVTFVVTSESSEKLRVAKELAAGKTRLDSLYTEVATANDRVNIRHHILGDYFDSVQVTDDQPTSFRLIFHPRPDADRYWKDLVVKILTSIRDSGVSVHSAKNL